MWSWLVEVENIFEQEIGDDRETTLFLNKFTKEILNRSMIDNEVRILRCTTDNQVDQTQDAIFKTLSWT